MQTQNNVDRFFAEIAAAVKQMAARRGIALQGCQTDLGVEQGHTLHLTFPANLSNVSDIKLADPSTVPGWFTRMPPRVAEQVAWLIQRAYGTPLDLVYDGARDGRLLLGQPGDYLIRVLGADQSTYAPITGLELMRDGQATFHRGSNPRFVRVKPLSGVDHAWLPSTLPGQRPTVGEPVVIHRWCQADKRTGFAFATVLEVGDSIKCCCLDTEVDANPYDVWTTIPALGATR